MSDYVICPCCDADQTREGAVLGTLGSWVYFRCRFCGAGWREKVYEKVEKNS